MKNFYFGIRCNQVSWSQIRNHFSAMSLKWRPSMESASNLILAAPCQHWILHYHPLSWCCFRTLMLTSGMTKYSIFACKWLENTGKISGILQKYFPSLHWVKTCLCPLLSKVLLPLIVFVTVIFFESFITLRPSLVIATSTGYLVGGYLPLDCRTQLITAFRPSIATTGSS